MVRRVAYVLNVFPKLSETFIAHELVELRRRGVELLVLSLRQPTEGLRHDFIAASGLAETVRYEPREFSAALRRFQPQVIHAHFATEPTAAACVFAAELGAPFTFTAHGYDIRRKPPADFAARATAARAVVTVSEANARQIMGSFGVAAAQLRIIPCGVDTQRFQASPGGRREEAAPVLVCVARQVPVKNLGLLLRACGILRDRAVPFRCVLVGDGPSRPELERLRGELKLEPWVEFAGAMEHQGVLQAWQQATIAVLSSENEGMPVCLMEAAACGVPAVATAVGGIPELIEHGVTGLLVPPGDAQALAAALEELIKDPVRTAEMGRAARRRVEEKFSLAGQIDALLGLWREVIQ